MSTIKRTVETPKSYSLDMPGRATLQDKLYVGFVKVADDVLRMGRLKVWIPELGGNPNNEAGWFIVNYCSPFAGATNIVDSKNENSFSSTQKSYGMWFIPPDINNEVICAFINGDPGRGIWLGCLYQQNMNHMVPGLPGQNTTDQLPVAEYNKRTAISDLNNPPRSLYEPLASQLIVQGLDKDTIRGVNSSGARRDEPANSVYGILTPGGSQFVFDDSDASNYIRLRTRSGAQIMINDTSGFIYLNSVNGKNWISMDATGKIDVYAQDDISIRSQGSLNLRADLDVNIESGRDINMRARGKPLVSSTIVRNPLADQPPPVTKGPSVIVGDSIAIGLGPKIKGSLVSASPTETSGQLVSRLQGNTTVTQFVNAVVSTGSYGSEDPATLTQNLQTIRTLLQAKKYIWILPYNAQANIAVSDFADSNGDAVVNLQTFSTNDNVHPLDYPLVANQASSLFIAETSVDETNTGSNQNVSPQYFNDLAKATLDAQTARLAASYAQANPEFYTEAQINSLKSDEASANATLQKLQGQGQTSSTVAQASAEPTVPNVAEGAQPPPVNSVPTWQEVAGPFIKREEGNGKPHLTAYRDPPNQTENYSIGFGHLMKFDIKSGATVLNCGSAGTVPIVGAGGRDTVMTAEQAEGLFQLDLLNRGATPASIKLKGAWDILGPYQKAAIVSYVYNCGPGGLNPLLANNLTDFINKNDIENAARLIEEYGYKGWNGNPTGLIPRRKREANLYRERSDLVGQQPTGREIDGYPATPSDQSATASGSISAVAPDLQGGFIRIESTNSMHVLSSQHMFVSSNKDMHHLAGGNSFTTTVKNINRVAGGYMHESVKQDYQLGIGQNMVVSAVKVDFNGPPPVAGISAAQAVGPVSLRQTDAVVNSLGNIVSIMTDTILPHLPYHEPYDNHGGRNYANIRDATSLDNASGLREGEIIINSAVPLDIYGTPRADMPVASYRGAGFNSQNQPLYRFESILDTAALMAPATMRLSEQGAQFIKSKENGSYRPVIVGDPPHQEIGYGHNLSPEEIRTKTIRIKGQTLSLEQSLSQQNIDDLFEEDMRLLQNWMRPLITKDLSQTQYDMFCSLAFNIGQMMFTSSPALKAYNDGNLQKVPNSWMKHVKNAANKVVSQLKVRRRAEIVQFMQGPVTDLPQNQSNTTVNTETVSL